MVAAAFQPACPKFEVHSLQSMSVHLPRLEMLAVKLRDEDDSKYLFVRPLENACYTSNELATIETRRALAVMSV
jgi:hypothetical protein